MSGVEKKSVLAEARFPVIVLAVTMLAPVILAIALVLWKTGAKPIGTRAEERSVPSEEVPRGSIRLTVTAPGMMSGRILVSRLDERGEKTQSLELEVRAGLARGDLALGDPAFEILIESERHEPKRLRVDLRRVTVMLEEKTGN